ncbi:MAG: DoxX family protein [Candidatus Magasanikbacteria bacterium]|nr:DoxX family protein [Candidatus Magasanikbacteria bacterium]
MCLCANKCGGQCKHAGLFLLRLALASIFLYAGYTKLGPGHEGTIGMFTSLGFGAPAFWAYFVGLAEFVGGAMLLLGVFVSYASAWLAVIMFIALLTVHRGGTFMSMYAPIAMLGGLFALMGTGAGKWALLKEACGGACAQKGAECTCGKCDACKTKMEVKK